MKAPNQLQVPAFFMGGDLSRRVDTYGLGPEALREAHAAIDRFKDRLRPGDDDRAALLKQMKGILSAEERDDFRAALERRPLVKAGPGGAQVVSGVVRGDVFVGSQIVPLPPARVVIPVNSLTSYVGAALPPTLSATADKSGGPYYDACAKGRWARPS
jgi:hypothetical protein